MQPSRRPRPLFGAAMTEALGAVPAFGSWAALYQRFRPGYPAPVFDRLAGLVGADHDLCVELGAGSGQATPDLLELFDRVIAVEPDRAMASLIPPSPRLHVVVESAERAQVAPGSAQAVVAATAYHWMDQIAVARRAALWLAPGGVFFAFAYGKVQYPDASRAVMELFQRQMRQARAHMDDRISSWRPYDRSLRESKAFPLVEAFEIYVEHSWTPAQAAGFMATTSFGQALARSTGDPDAYLERLTDELAVAAGGRPIIARIPIEGAYGRVGTTIS